MTEEELSDWVIDKLNSCYIITHKKYEGSYFLYYDESYVRKLKLSKLSNTVCSLPTKINGMCLFEINFEYENLYCDSYIFEFIYKNNKSIDNDIFFHNILRKTKNLLTYTANSFPCKEYFNSKFEDRLDSLTIVDNFNINKMYDR